MLLFLNFLSNEIKSMNGYLYSINFIIEISIMIKFFKKAAFLWKIENRRNITRVRKLFLIRWK